MSNERILLIEDDPTLCDITAFRLELLGYTIDAAQTAVLAEQAIQTNRPDLIIVGHQTETNAIDLMNQFSNDIQTSEIPLICLSAHTDLEEVQRAFNAGADEFLVTPYDPMVLEKKVEGLFAAIETGQN